jgi:ribosomal protein S18 acetylase RimI-like enzyme
VLRREQGSVAGGVEGNAGPHWAYVATLWVHPDRRGEGWGEGWGERLMTAVENEAMRRGCIGVCLTTFTHQATGFYERLGYEEYGRLDEWPGEHRIEYAKRFAPGAVRAQPL